MGARTVASGSSEFLYLNIRRLFCMVEESIAQSMRWTLFEPNNFPLWMSIQRDVTAFLMRLWRDGALQGSRPEHAFFVKCDAETNPQENIDAGIVTTVIGMAPVKPAEFVVFRISQYAGGTEIESLGGSNA
jgi:phage tail sheath protein FI